MLFVNNVSMLMFFPIAAVAGTDRDGSEDSRLPR